jgi:hypothetical protein
MRATTVSKPAPGQPCSACCCCSCCCCQMCCCCPAASPRAYAGPAGQTALFANTLDTATPHAPTPPPTAPFVRQAGVPSPAPMAPLEIAFSRKPPSSTCFPARESSLTHDPPKHFPYKIPMAARVISTDKFRTWGQPFSPLLGLPPVRRPAKG